MNEALIALAIQETPAIVARLKELFKRDNPNTELTDEQVIAAYEAAFASSLAKDDAWLAAHPEVDPTHEG